MRNDSGGFTLLRGLANVLSWTSCVCVYIFAGGRRVGGGASLPIAHVDLQAVLRESTWGNSRSCGMHLGKRQVGGFSRSQPADRRAGASCPGKSVSTWHRAAPPTCYGRAGMISCFSAASLTFRCHAGHLPFSGRRATSHISPIRRCRRQPRLSRPHGAEEPMYLCSFYVCLQWQYLQLFQPPERP